MYAFNNKSTSRRNHIKVSNPEAELSSEFLDKKFEKLTALLPFQEVVHKIYLHFFWELKESYFFQLLFQA